MDKQNNRLIARSLIKMFPATFAYAVIMGFMYIVDTLIAGCFIGSDAISAVALGLPVYGMFIALSHAVVQGTQIRMTWLLGRADQKNCSRAFSGGFYLALAVGLVFILIITVFARFMVMLTGGSRTDETIVKEAAIYVRFCAPMVLFMVLSGIVRETAGVFGRQSIKAIGGIVNILCNIAFSILLVIILPSELKIIGLGIGSSLAAAVELILGIIMLKRKKVRISFKLCVLDKHEIKEVFKIGTPSSIDHFVDCIAAGIINNIILSAFPAEPLVLSTAAVVNSIRDVGKTAGNGVCYAAMPLFGVLYGERDKSGLEKAFYESVRFGLIVSALWTVIIIASTPFLSALYGMSVNTDVMLGAVITSLMLPAAFVLHLLICFYEATECDMSSLFASIFPDSVLYPIMLVFLIPLFGKIGIWLAMGGNCILGLTVIWIIFIILKSRKKLDSDKMFMLKSNLTSRVPTLDITIANTNKDVSYISERIYQFLEGTDTSGRTKYISALCTEELAADMVAHLKKQPIDKESKIMDIKLFNDDDSIEILIKSFGEPYDPLDFEIDKETFGKMGVKLAQKVAREIIYSYVYRLNVISIILEKNAL